MQKIACAARAPVSSSKRDEQVRALWQAESCSNLSARPDRTQPRPGGPETGLHDQDSQLRHAEARLGDTEMHSCDPETRFRDPEMRFRDLEIRFRDPEMPFR